MERRVACATRRWSDDFYAAQHDAGESAAGEHFQRAALCEHLEWECGKNRDGGRGRADDERANDYESAGIPDGDGEPV